MTDPSPVRRFVGGMLMAVGGLIAGLSGLCTGGFLVFVAYSLWRYGYATGGAYPAYATLLVPLAFGAIPIILGLGLFFLGRALFRSSTKRERLESR